MKRVAVPICAAMLLSACATDGPETPGETLRQPPPVSYRAPVRVEPWRSPRIETLRPAPLTRVPPAEISSLPAGTPILGDAPVSPAMTPAPPLRPEKPPAVGRSGGDPAEIVEVSPDAEERQRVARAAQALRAARAVQAARAALEKEQARTAAAAPRDRANPKIRGRFVRFQPKAPEETADAEEREQLTMAPPRRKPVRERPAQRANAAPAPNPEEPAQPAPRVAARPVPEGEAPRAVPQPATPGAAVRETEIALNVPAPEPKPARVIASPVPPARPAPESPAARGAIRPAPAALRLPATGPRQPDLTELAEPFEPRPVLAPAPAFGSVTRRDAQIDALAVDAGRYGIGEEATGMVDDTTAELDWGDATRLLQAGEIRSYADLGNGELFMTMCSGRGVLTRQDPAEALPTLRIPSIICGRRAELVAE